MITPSGWDTKDPTISPEARQVTQEAKQKVSGAAEKAKAEQSAGRCRFDPLFSCDLVFHFVKNLQWRSQDSSRSDFLHRPIFFGRAGSGSGFHSSPTGGRRDPRRFSRDFGIMPGGSEGRRLFLGKRAGGRGVRRLRPLPHRRRVWHRCPKAWRRFSSRGSQKGCASCGNGWFPRGNQNDM